jgi:hypothetical protein
MDPVVPFSTTTTLSIVINHAATALTGDRVEFAHTFYCILYRTKPTDPNLSTSNERAAGTLRAWLKCERVLTIP